MAGEIHAACHLRRTPDADASAVRGERAALR